MATWDLGSINNFINNKSYLRLLPLTKEINHTLGFAIAVLQCVTEAPSGKWSGEGRGADCRAKAGG